MVLMLSALRDRIGEGQRLLVWPGLLSCLMGVICRVMLSFCGFDVSNGDGGADSSLRIAGMAETMAFNYNSKSNPTPKDAL
jgi:hypothetical protein